MRPSDSDTPSVPTIALLGAGRVGGSLHGALIDGGHDARLASRDDLDRALEGAEVVLLCVPDGQIAEACESVLAARAADSSTLRPLRHVGHTSGASTLAPLAAARDAGLGVLSIHPLQTIPTPRTILAGAPAAVAASDQDALTLAERIAVVAGMQPFAVPEESRAAYHAAASIASNFLIALEESAGELLTRAGVGDARELLAPLVLRTAANWADRGAEALTGPIARGDEGTVERHRRAIAELAPELGEAYEALAARTRAIAAERAGLHGERAA